MKKLTRFSSFDDMKSTTNSHWNIEVDNDLAISDFEEFIKLIRNKKVNIGDDRKLKPENGKQVHQ